MKLQRQIILLGACGIFATLPATISAREASQSVADAARKAKEQQKQASKPKVWTNDNLPTSATVSVVGQVPQKGTEAGATGAEAATAASADSGGDLKSDHDKAAAELATAQKDLTSVKADLDLAQRTYKLDSDQLYGSPDYANDRQGKAKLDNDKDQISTKQQAVDAAQKKVDDLQKQLDALNEKSKTTPDSSQPKS